MKASGTLERRRFASSVAILRAGLHRVAGSRLVCSPSMRGGAVDVLGDEGEAAQARGRVAVADPVLGLLHHLEDRLAHSGRTPAAARPRASAPHG